MEQGLKNIGESSYKTSFKYDNEDIDEMIDDFLDDCEFLEVNGKMSDKEIEDMISSYLVYWLENNKYDSDLEKKIANSKYFKEEKKLLVEFLKSE